MDLFYIDTLIYNNNLYDDLIDMESPSIGNIIFYFFGQNYLLKILKSFLPFIQTKIDRSKDVKIIKIKEIDNILNQNKLLSLNNFYKKCKGFYSKISRICKTFPRRQLEVEIANLVIQKDSAMFNVFIFDITEENINATFYNNKNYLNLQIKNSGAYNKIIKYVNNYSIIIGA